jgi:hypothetical protein
MVAVQELDAPILLTGMHPASLVCHGAFQCGVNPKLISVNSTSDLSWPMSTSVFQCEDCAEYHVLPDAHGAHFGG